MSFTFTGAGVQDKHEYTLPPVGEYDVKIVEAQEKISRASGKNMIELVCEIQHQQYKSRLWEYIVDNEYAQQRIYDILTSCGFTPKAGMTISAETFSGRSGRVKIKHETSNGETKARINYWIKPRASAPAESNAEATSADKSKNSADGIPF